MRVFSLVLSALFLSGCAWLSEGRDPNLPSAAEMGAGECRPAGPHDPAAPGEWVCDDGDGDVEMRPRHRVENPQ
ncbi:hypothetical protein [Maricaulis maris]|jgi:hypothetical protein|uniref:hypothetical protein n=1 Tax=Maricaulis maris TaxID=74318 RepID=UPI0026EEDFA1|nr:hypothetical protein [Maricaulis maris]